LDGKTIKTNDKNILQYPNQIIMQLIQNEWQNQIDFIDLRSMPVTRFLSGFLDANPEQNGIDWREKILSYLETDLILYIEPKDQAMRKAQFKVWKPVHDYIDQRFKTPLLIQDQLAPQSQSKDLKVKINDVLVSLDSLELFLFLLATLQSSSVLCTLYFFDHKNTDDFFEQVFAEDLHKAKLYNEDFYGASPDQEFTRHHFKQDMDAILKMLNALTSGK
jgi:chaperone required for assembly of F1-ATPase